MDPSLFQTLFVCLGVAWVLITLYAVSLGLRERRIKSELERVRRMIEKG